MKKAIQMSKEKTISTDLRFNRFEELPANAFEGLTQVTTLFLNENEISYVEESAFDGLKSLRFLYLNNNRISRLPSNIFQQLKQLEAIFIFNNKLTNVPANAFNRLPSLKRLRLDDNPIDCNCGVYSLWRYHQQHPQRKAITIALTCETPASLYRYGFSSLQEYHFHCKKPEIITAPHDIHVTTGETVELPCHMTGDPQPEIVWMQNTNEINADFAPKMQILPTGTLKIYAFNSNDIGIYECIGRNEVGETRTQPIRIMMMMMMTTTTTTTTTMTLPKKGTNANNNNNNNNQYGPYYSSDGGSHNDNNNNNNNNVYVSNQLWHDQQHIETEEAQQHQLELSPRHTSKLATNNDNNGVERQRSSNTNSNNNNIWHTYALSSDATTQGPAINVTGLIEQAHPHFIHTPKDRVVAVSAIESLRLDCVAVGVPTPEIQWYFNGRLVAQSTDALRIQANGSLPLPLGEQY
uniref:Ig-like domain-containing protein n=1 Tax=Glossina pallidipes TaxID=7398 RepID=A0A1B0AI47_GLOPL